MKFGKQLRAKMNPKFSTEYVDYKRLKQLIKELAGRGGEADVDVEAKRAEFLQHLQRELFQVDNFFRSRIRALQKNFDALSQRVIAASAVSESQSGPPPPTKRQTRKPQSRVFNEAAETKAREDGSPAPAPIPELAPRKPRSGRLNAADVRRASADTASPSQSPSPQPPQQPPPPPLLPLQPPQQPSHPVPAGPSGPGKASRGRMNIEQLQREVEQFERELAKKEQVQRPRSQVLDMMALRKQAAAKLAAASAAFGAAQLPEGAPAAASTSSAAATPTAAGGESEVVKKFKKGRFLVSEKVATLPAAATATSSVAGSASLGSVDAATVSSATITASAPGEQRASSNSSVRRRASLDDTAKTPSGLVPDQRRRSVSSSESDRGSGDGDGEELRRPQLDALDLESTSDPLGVTLRLRSDPQTAERISARLMIIKLGRNEADLESYLLLNMTAIQKISKKFDKRFGTHLQEDDVPEMVAKLKSKLEQAQALRKTILELLTEHAKPPPMGEDDETNLEDFLVEDEVPTVTDLALNALPAGEITQLKLALAKDAFGQSISVPVIVAKGKYEGPVVGITSALHGNELNGIPLIFRLFREMDVENLCGYVVAVPVLNPPGYHRNQRYYSDGSDLNRMFPGRPNGSCGQQFARAIVERLIVNFTHLIDLHTASSGRINSLYVRADMTQETTRMMALLQNPQIILHNPSPDGSLRSAAMSLGIAAITVEIGNPQAFNKRFVRYALHGVENILYQLHMLKHPIEPPKDAPVICSKSFWIYSQAGGVLEVLPEINTWVHKDQLIAVVRNIFGELVASYRAPQDGIVIGKSVNPCCASGDRILHLGIVKSKFSHKSSDGKALVRAEVADE
jgi:predicted deacylase